MRRNRTLVVRVSSSVIGDGEIAPPTMNEILTGPLTFVELPEDCADAVRIRALLMPSGTDPILQYTGQGSPRRWQWTGLLRGDGWTASWRGFVPRTGEVELTGRFWGTFGHDTEGRFRGRVTRVQMAAERYRRSGRHGWEHVPGFGQVRDVDSAPRFFGVDALLECTGDTTELEDSVRVELDLDDVPALPVRPSVVPGDVSTCRAAMWVVDASLPIILCLDADQKVRRYLLSGNVGTSRQVHATPSGCWATGSDGTYWLPTGSEPIRVDDQPVAVGAAVGDSMLAMTGTSTWRLYSPDADVLGVDAVAGFVTSVAVQGNSVHAVVRPERESHVRVVRVSESGESMIGPEIPLLPRRHGEPYLLGSPLRLVRGSDVGLLQSDLSVRNDGQLGERLSYGGQAGRVAWTVGHVPDGSSTSGWWPLPGPVEHDYRTSSWLLTLHDAATLEPSTSVVVTSHRPRVVVDGEQLIVVGRGIRRFDIDSPLMDHGEELDVARLWEQSSPNLP